MSDESGSSPSGAAPAGAQPGFGPDLAEVFGPTQRDGGPELIQLLTPEGERVHHPEFDHDFSAEELLGLYRDMVLTRAERAACNKMMSCCSRATQLGFGDFDPDRHQTRKRSSRDGPCCGRGLPNHDPRRNP